MAKPRRCHVLLWPNVDEADDDGMADNLGRRVNAVTWLTRVFWSVVLVTQATSREEDEQHCCHSKADA
jgi:hypothetical protein